MAVPRMVADFYTQATLGRPGLEELSRNLWPDTCQTCGRPLEGEAPAVVVTDFADVTASLHHRACQRPRWTKQPKDLDLRHVTTSACLISVPFGNPSRDPFRPTVLVNPSHEVVKLANEHEGYRASTVAEWSLYGLARPSGSTIAPGHPDHVAAWLTPGGLIVRCGNRIWRCAAETFRPELAAEIERAGSVVLAVSSALDPSRMENPEQIKRVIRTGDIAVAEIPLETRIPAPAVTGHTALRVSDLAAAGETGDADWLPDLVPVRSLTYSAETGRFEMGLGMDGPYHWQLHSPGVGGEHGLIAGPPESGKTNALRLVVVEALCSSRFGIAIADPADRNGLVRSFSRWIRDAAQTEERTVAMVHAVAEQVLRRVRAGRANLAPTPEDPGLVLVIDDAQLVLRDPAVAAAAETIALHGPRLSVGLVAATDSADLEAFGGRADLLRALCRTNCFPLSRSYYEALRNYTPRG